MPSFAATRLPRALSILRIRRSGWRSDWPAATIDSGMSRRWVPVTCTLSLQPATGSSRTARRGFRANASACASSGSGGFYHTFACSDVVLAALHILRHIESRGTNPAPNYGSHLGGVVAKVFVSHHKSDAEEARRLSRALLAAGHDVWFDEWEIEPGTSIVSGIDRGLVQSQYVIVCYSRDSVGSPWMNREWMSTLARQLSEHSVRILPVRLTGALAPPALLADIRYADLVADWDRGLAELIRAIR